MKNKQKNVKSKLKISNNQIFKYQIKNQEQQIWSKKLKCIKMKLKEWKPTETKTKK